MRETTEKCCAHHSSTAKQNFLSIFIMHVGKEAKHSRLIKNEAFGACLAFDMTSERYFLFDRLRHSLMKGKRLTVLTAEVFMLSTRFSRLINFDAYRVFPVNPASLSRWYPSASAFDVCASGELERARQHKLCELDVLNLWRKIKKRLGNIFIIFPLDEWIFIQVKRMKLADGAMGIMIKKRRISLEDVAFE